MVGTMSVVMYKKLGMPNEAIAFYTSWLTLPWVLKPLWSPGVDINGTKRGWIVGMETLMAAALALVGLSLLSGHFFAPSLALFFLTGVFSATHDIAADGFYMIGLTGHGQVWWSGLRNTFYRVAMTFGSGWLVLLAGHLETGKGDVPQAWCWTLLAASGLFFVGSVWHRFMLPRPARDGPVRLDRNWGAEFLATFGSFFRKPGVGLTLAFILLYRLDEAQLSKVVPLFLLDKAGQGGLGLTTQQYGLAYGIYGVTALTCGGLAGGFLAAKYGLKRMLPVMLAAMYLPKLAFIYLSCAQPRDFALICGAVTGEQFGYGFGFTAFMLYLLYFARGPHQTAHYALCTGFMTLGLMAPGLASGWLAEHLGYTRFFVWVFWSAGPGLIIALLLKIDPEFGRR